MKDNLKRDWNEIVAFHLSDDGEFLEELRFLLKLKKPTEEELLDVQFCRLSKAGANFLKRINEEYSISEKEELLKKLQIFNTPHTVNSVPLAELPESSVNQALILMNKMATKKYRQNLAKAVSSYVPKS